MKLHRTTTHREKAQRALTLRTTMPGSAVTPGRTASVARAGALAAAGVALALTISGCVEPAPASNPPAPSPSATASSAPTTSAPAPSPAASAAASPTATSPAPEPAYDPSDPGTWIIDFAGVGPMAIGEGIGAVEAAMPVSVSPCRPGVDTYDLAGIGATAVSGIDDDDLTAPVVVVRLLSLEGYDPAAPQPHTAAGISLASTVDELLAAYPDAQSYDGPQGSTAYRITDGTNYIHFEDYGSGTVMGISVQPSATVATEYCGA